MNPVIFANITYYFTEKRGMINSLCLAIISAIAFMFPMIIQKMKSYYGQFGTLMVLAALSLHTMVSMILMQPVEWHLIKRLRYENETIQKSFAGTHFLYLLIIVKIFSRWAALCNSNILCLWITLNWKMLYLNSIELLLSKILIRCSIPDFVALAV